MSALLCSKFSQDTTYNLQPSFIEDMTQTFWLTFFLLCAYIFVHVVPLCVRSCINRVNRTVCS